MHDLGYWRPATVADAVALKRDAPDAAFLAGGMTLIPVMRLGLARPGALIDLSALKTLRAIIACGREVTIGSLATHGAIADSPVVQERLPGLAALARSIGDPQVRNRGTIGGSLANNDPAADYPAAMLALDATVVTDRREIAADVFFTGMFETALGDDELITAVRIPAAEASGYAKVRQPASGYALAGVFVARSRSGARVAVTGAGSCVFRLPDLEEALARAFSPAAAAGLSVPPEDLGADIHASAEYRSHLVGVLARRAITAASVR